MSKLNEITITIKGPAGSGKSILATRIVDMLRAHGCTSITEEFASRTNDAPAEIPSDVRHRSIRICERQSHRI